jgi:hypothetical protein
MSLLGVLIFGLVLWAAFRVFGSLMVAIGVLVLFVLVNSSCTLNYNARAWEHPFRTDFVIGK